MFDSYDITPGQKAAVVVGLFALVAVLFGFQTWIMTMLWNWLAAGVFGAPRLTFWQMAGFSVLLSFVGSFFKTRVIKKD